MAIASGTRLGPYEVTASIGAGGMDDRPFERFLRHCARYWAIAPRTYPRGVFRFRTIEDAQQARLRVTGRVRTSPSDQGA